MDFRLKVFTTVYQTLSFTKASNELFISQPAVTKHINELEKQYSAALFNRHGNSISPTPAGKLLYSYSTQIIQLYEDVENEFLLRNNDFPDTLNIGASTTISQYILPKILSKLKSVYPNTVITLLNENSETIERLLLNNKINIGFTEGATKNPLLHFEDFLDDEIILVSKTGNLKNKTISVDEFSKLPLVMREKGSGTRDIIEKELISHGYDLKNANIEHVLGSSESIKTYLLNSNAVAFLSINTISDELDRGVLEVLQLKNIKIKRCFQIVTHHGEYSNIILKIKHFFFKSL